MKNFRRLTVWQDSMEMVEKVYRITLTLPDNEKYGLVSQMQRCAVSVPSNIAEGYGRGEKEFMYFLRVAIGSSFELETQLLLCERVGLIDKDKIESLIDLINSIQRKINALNKSVRTNLGK